jgi:hypothetical protein
VAQASSLCVIVGRQRRRFDDQVARGFARLRRIHLVFPGQVLPQHREGIGRHGAGVFIDRNGKCRLVVVRDEHG